MIYHRPLFALLLGAGFLSACSGGAMQQSSLLPQTAARDAMAIGGGGGGLPTPAPLGAMTILAGVDLNIAVLSTFVVTDPKQCFGAASKHGEDEEGNSDEHRWQNGEHHHYGNDGGGVQFGTPYTPTSNTTLSFGPFSLTDPCAGSTKHHGHDEESGTRFLRNIVPVPTGAGAHIVAQDSTDPTHALIDIDGPATDDGTTYTFALLRFGRTFRVGHTYTFALAVPATPTPAPTPTPAHGHEGDDD